MNLSSIDLNLLWTLHVVLEEGSVKAAARRLCVTGPAVSNALSRARGALRDPLLVRSGRHLVPTPRALALAPALSRAFDTLEAAVQKGASVDPVQVTRAFRLALSDADQVARLPSMFARLHARLPRASLHVVSIDTMISEGGVAAPSIDAAVGPPPAEAPGLHHAPIHEERAVFLVRAGHPLAGERVTAAAFGMLEHVDVRLVLGRPGQGNQRATAALDEQGFRRQIVATVPGFVPAALLAASSDVVAGVPAGVQDALAERFGLVALRGEVPHISFPLSLIWHERTHHDPVSQLFRRCLLGEPHDEPER